MKIYSPSQTIDYLWCPVYRHLRQEGWAKKEIGNRETAAILGSAFAAGMASYNVAYGQCSKNKLIEGALDKSAKELERRYNELGKFGLLSTEVSRVEVLETLTKRLQKALTKSIDNDPIPPQWERRHVEFEIPDSGRSTIDLGLWTGQEAVVLDYKHKARLEAKYVGREVAKWRRSWQLLHYSFFYGKFMGIQPTRYIILLTILEPSFQILPLDMTTVWLTDEMLSQWHSFAQQVWADMEAEEKGERVIRGRTDCYNQYGPCEYERACWSFHYDESLMEKEYVKH